eukprot:symbB.v1.2.028992.t3/scaffold3111.1/size63350/7
MEKLGPALEVSGHLISVVGPPVYGFYAGLYKGYKALPREAATCLWGACTSADEAKMTELGSGNADGTFPKILSNCGKRNYNIFSGFNAHNFVDCVKENTGVTFDCGACFVAPARYGANNCKWSCLWGSWCGKGCLDCIGNKNEESQQCAGVKVPTATVCR